MSNNNLSDRRLAAIDAALTWADADASPKSPLPMKKLPDLYKVLFVLSGMLTAGLAGLPADMFWTKFSLSVLLAGVLGYRELMEKPPTIVL